MALLTAQVVALAGITPSYAAVAASDTFAPDDDLFLHVKNGGGSPDTVTFTDNSRTAGGSAATNPTVSVPAGQERIIGPIPQVFQNTSTGIITVAHSFTTSVTCALFRI